MQNACHLLLAFAAATAQPADGPSTNPLDYCKITIIDEVHVPAEEAGVLVSLNVREGALVEKGALLGQIDDKDALLAVEMSVNEYEAAKKEAENTLSIQHASKSHEVALAEYQQAIEANKQTPKTITLTEVRRKLLTAQRAEMQIDLAKHELDIAKLTALVKYKQYERAEAMLKRRKIVSRINGVVVEVLKHAGDWVAPGDTVMRIVRMDQLRVEGYLDGSQYARHEVLGRPVEIEVQLTGGGSERLEGVISFASPLIESNEYKVWADIDNIKVGKQWLLNPGLNATMRLGSVALVSDFNPFP